MIHGQKNIKICDFVCTLSFPILYVVCLKMLPVAETIKLQAIGFLVYNELERFLREESYHIVGHHY